MRLYLESIYTKKILFGNLINIAGLIILNLLFSGVFDSKHDQIIYRETYMINYLYQSILFAKITIFVLSFVLVYQTKNIIGIIALDTINQTRIKVIMKYISVSLLVLIINIMIIYFVFEITGLFLTYYYTNIQLKLLFRLILLGIFIYLILLTVYFYTESIYSLLFTFIMYLVVIMNSGFYINYQELNTFTKFSHLVVSDLVLTSDLNYSFLYGDIYVFTLILALFIVVVRRFIKKDLM